MRLRTYGLRRLSEGEYKFNNLEESNDFRADGKLFPAPYSMGNVDIYEDLQWTPITAFVMRNEAQKTFQIAQKYPNHELNDLVNYIREVLCLITKHPKNQVLN